MLIWKMYGNKEVLRGIEVWWSYTQLNGLSGIKATGDIDKSPILTEIFYMFNIIDIRNKVRKSLTKKKRIVNKHQNQV